MFGPQQQQQLSKMRRGAEAIKLPRLWNVPATKDISTMLELAQNAQGQFIEQSWSPEEKDLLLNLSVQVDNEGDPLWELEENTLHDTKVLWQHRTGDTALIHNLIVGESTGEMAATRQDYTGQIYLRSPKESQEVRAVPPGDRLVETDATAILEGDINKVRLTTVLQSIQLSRMTGRLAIRGESCGADVYFDEGVATHASDGVDMGDEVIIELIQLTAGKFKFLPDERTVKRTVTRNIDRLLLEAITLLDQSDYLNEQGLKGESYLIVKNPGITLEEFIRIVTTGAPVDQELQKILFKDIGEFRTLVDLLKMRALKKSQWVPVLFNLVSLNLVGIGDRPPQQRTVLDVKEEEVQALDSYEAVLKPLMRPTGLLIYPALQYFIALECNRNVLSPTASSLVVLSLTRRSNGQSPDVATVHEIFEIVNRIKRPVDIPGHFQMFDYAILMPEANARSAAAICQKIHETVTNSHYKTRIDAADILMYFGIASMPDDCRTMAHLLSAALEAHKQARLNESPIMLFQNLAT